MGKRGPGSMSYLKWASVMRNIKTDVVHDAFFQYVSLFGAYFSHTHHFLKRLIKWVYKKCRKTDNFKPPISYILQPPSTLPCVLSVFQIYPRFLFSAIVCRTWLHLRYSYYRSDFWLTQHNITAVFVSAKLHLFILSETCKSDLSG